MYLIRSFRRSLTSWSARIGMCFRFSPSVPIAWQMRFEQSSSRRTLLLTSGGALASRTSVTGCLESTLYVRHQFLCGSCQSNLYSRTWGEIDLAGISWVIVGGESGPGARSMSPSWVDKIFAQCREQRVPFFFKQWGGTRKKKTGRLLHGRTYDEMPRWSTERV
jgi:phage protein Gp37/Gp68